jgi:hypothetical protein
VTISTIAGRRLLSQQIASPRFATPAPLVRWMGAVQAQDYRGSLWAVALRLRDAVEADVERALADRSIVRTWPMRGTLHYVPAPDVRWMLRLLTPRVLARSAGRYRELGLDEAAFTRSRRILTRALEGGGALTRSEVYETLQKGGVSPEGQRGIHIIGHLAQQGVLCLGPRRGRQPTFVMLDDWLPASKDKAREEALATLAERYFTSHGPATIQDFAWWSGLKVKEAQAATEEAGAALTSETRGRRRWFHAAASERSARPKGPVAVLLPTWDEYVVAYKDRRGVLEFGDAEGPRYAVGLSLVLLDGRVVGTWKRTLIVIDGRVRGSWKRAVARSSVQVRLDFWNRVTGAEQRAVWKAAARYAKFVGLDLEIAGTQSARRTVS